MAQIQTHAQAPDSGQRQQELQVEYQNLKNKMQEIAQKIGNVENDAEEHKLVLETLQPLSSDRKCFQMIHGVLAEKKVEDVIPSLRTNSEGLRKVLDELVKSYDAARKELETWKKKNNVQIVQQ